MSVLVAFSFDALLVTAGATMSHLMTVIRWDVYRSGGHSVKDVTSLDFSYIVVSCFSYSTDISDRLPWLIPTTQWQRGSHVGG